MGGNVDGETNKLARLISETLDVAYDAAINGIPGRGLVPAIESASDLADDYRVEGRSTSEQARSLVHWQVGKAGAVGFVAGLPGLAAAPVSIPAELGTVWVLQLRMAAAIAVLGGHNPHHNKVRAFCYMCLAGMTVGQMGKELGVKLGAKLAIKAVEKVPGKVLVSVNKAVGFRLVTKFGEKGLVNLGKAVPFVGGIVSGAFDATSTKAVGELAISTFIDE